MYYLIIISGPGGSGKDTVIAELLKDRSLGLKKLVNYTSRHPRKDEIDGRDYYFLTREQYEREIAHGHILEHEIMESNNHYYGTNKNQLLKDLEQSNVICKKMPLGSLKLKEYFNNRSFTIFIDASNDELEKRLLEGNRAIEHSLVRRRLIQAEHERAFKNQFDYCIVNHDGDLNKVVGKVRDAISAWIEQHHNPKSS